MPQAQTVALPKRWPLALSPENRTSSPLKDASIVNAYMERDTETGDYWLFKRPGLLLHSQPSGTTGAGRGIFNWLGDIYSITDTTIYKNTTSLGTVDGTNGIYAFSQSSGATPRLVLGNGVKAYTYDGTTFAQITDGDFPSAFLKGWAYLDKTTYVAYLPNNILGSDLDDPTSWDPLNLINAQIKADKSVGLAQHLVYVIGFKETSTEFFYDAANATGSPLSTVQGSKVNWGCASMDTVQEIDGMLFWVASNQDASPQVLHMEKGNARVISTPAIERLLNSASFSSCFSWTFKEFGHWFYSLTITSLNLTIVYDVKERQWATWQDTNGNYFPIVSTTKGSGTSHLFQHETNGKIYTVDNAYATDDGTVFSVDAITPNFDGGTRRGKQLGRIDFDGDLVQSNLYVRHTDDDFNSWSNWRIVDLARKRPHLSNCGTFSRRAYHLRHRAPTTFRIKAMDLQLDLCTI